MPDGVTVEFAEAVHSSDALNAAAYRLMDVASCHVDRADKKFVCHLVPKSGAGVDGETVKMRFLDYVTDETVRERLATKTEPVRNLILSLAFGALASQPDSTNE
jgi:His-Xaa-Ser system protein HxsD